MFEHKPVASFGVTSWPTEKLAWVKSVALGTLIAAAGFTLALSFLAWFIPKFSIFSESRWGRLLPAITILFISTGGLLRYFRNRRTSIRRGK